MADHARSEDPEVQRQLDRLTALSPGRDILGLERIRSLLERLGNPEQALPPVFHVAGTNGKGSTCAFLRAALEAAGYSVHVYTSPHLARFNERIRLAGRLIDLMTGFIGDHPAYLALSAASTPTNRSDDDRSRLRQRFAELFAHRRTDLAPADALRVAEVLLQIVKGLPPLYMAAKPKERRLLIDEYKTAVTAYLTARLN